MGKVFFIMLEMNLFFSTATSLYRSTFAWEFLLNIIRKMSIDFQVFKVPTLTLLLLYSYFSLSFERVNIGYSRPKLTQINILILLLWRGKRGGL